MNVSLDRLAQLCAALAAALLAPHAQAQTPLAGGYVASGPGFLIYDPGDGAWPWQLPSQFTEVALSVPNDALTIEEVRINGLVHQSMGQLQFVLVSPTGQAVTLEHRLGFDGSNAGWGCDFIGDYSISVEPDQLWPSSNPGPGFLLPPGAYAQHFGNWPSGAAGIFNVPLRSLAVPPGTWRLRIYDWSGGTAGWFQGWEIRGARKHAFNVDFDFFSTPSSSYAAAAQSGTWNSISVAPLVNPIQTTDGVGPPAQLAQSLGWGLLAYPGPSGDAGNLLRDALRSSFPIELRVDGIRNGLWSVWVYAWDPSDLERSAVTVHGGTGGTQPLGGPWSGAVQQGVTHAYDEVFVTAHRLSITIEGAVGDPFANGFQLVYRGGTIYDWQPYCVMGESQNGCFPTLVANGSLSLGASAGFTLQCYDVDGQRNGLFLYGLDAAQVPFGAGYLCMSAPRQRAGGVQGSGGTAGACDGYMSLDLRAWLAGNFGALGQPLTAGQALYCQTWYRDSGSGSSNSNTSDAIAAYVVP